MVAGRSVEVAVGVASNAVRPPTGGHGPRPSYMKPMVELDRHRWLHLEPLV